MQALVITVNLLQQFFPSLERFILENKCHPQTSIDI